MQNSARTLPPAQAHDPNIIWRDVRCEYSENFPARLASVSVSLLISTYHAGKLTVLGVHDGQLALSMQNFDRPMGLAVHPGGFAVGASNQIWFLRNAPQIGPWLQPPGKFDACFLTRASQVTGDIRCHDMAWAGDELWIVNTLFSCLCTLDANYHFMPRWRPSFISGLVPEDRCHLNGLALADGAPKFVTCLGVADTAEGWRPGKASGGCLLDVPSGETVVSGLCMPHSPRIHAGALWVLESGRGKVLRIEPTTGQITEVATVPGFARGLCFAGSLAFVGLSHIRASGSFGGIPLAERRDHLKCGIAVIDVKTGKQSALFEFTAGAEELFDVAALAGIRMPAVHGPYSDDDGERPIWLLPPE